MISTSWTAGMTVSRVKFDAVGRDALPDLVDVVVEVGLEPFGSCCGLSTRIVAPERSAGSITSHGFTLDVA